MNSQANGKKRFYIHTLGCKVNQYESQAMRELLIGAGFEDSGSRDNADIYIVNTCTVTGEADRESKSVMGQFHRSNPGAKIFVTGCFAENNASDILSLPGITMIIKNSEKNAIAQFALGRDAGVQVKDLSISDFKNHSKAYLKIQDGCENRCSYCKVPLVRGKLRSKPVDDIVKEVGGLVGNGFREIILTGICLGAWGKDLRQKPVSNAQGLNGMGLVDVLKVMDKIKGDFRIRLSSIEPKYATDELIEFIANNKRICTHLHIPFQSGSDEILKLMNRPYTSSEYRAIVGRVRAKIPAIAITTDILVGFPGETPAMFKDTLAFIKDVSPSRTHIFTFSGREGTVAYDMPYSIDRETLKERYRDMDSVAIEAADAYRRSFLGKELQVLVESKRDKATGMLKGYSENYINILFSGPDDLMRKVAPVKVTGFDNDQTVGGIWRKKGLV